MKEICGYKEAEQSKTDRHCVDPFIPREERRKLFKIQQMIGCVFDSKRKPFTK